MPVLFSAVTLLLLFGCRAQAQSEPVVETESGAVRGATISTVSTFKDIPYAAAPEGDWRWRPPRRAERWDGERNATAWGPRCAQVDSAGKISGVEDCLRLNVWTPAGAERGSRPVLVWIHGGSLLRGTAMSSSTDGARLVERTGIVLVSINYRLGAFGYLADRRLQEESGTTGNYGLLDQIAALEWVQRNIAGFGGDPQRVGIFGQSAGGFSVCSLIASPLAKNLFSAAIVMSGSCNTARPWDVATAAGDRFVTAAGCGSADDPVSCLRALSTEAVLRALPPDTGYAATVDGHAFTELTERTLSRGAHNRVPVILGNTTEEEGGTTAEIYTASDFENAVLKLFPYPTAMPLIRQQYPLWEYESPRAAYVAFATDYKYACPARRAARALLAGQIQPVYRYVFSHRADNAPPEVRALGAWHGSDVPYIFDRVEASGYEVTEAERGLVDAFARYFTTIAATGSVTGAEAPVWPPYDGSDTFLRLDTEIRAGEDYRKRQCDFWDYLLPLKP